MKQKSVSSTPHDPKYSHSRQANQPLLIAEILAEIFRHLQSADLLRCLCASPRSSSPFFKTARRELYTHIEVTNPRKFPVLLRSLALKPSLIKCARSLTTSANHDWDAPATVALVTVAILQLHATLKSINVPFRNNSSRPELELAISECLQVERLKIGTPQLHLSPDLLLIFSKNLKLRNMRTITLYPLPSDKSILGQMFAEMPELEELGFSILPGDNDDIDFILPLIGRMKSLSIAMTGQRLRAPAFRAFLARQAGLLEELHLEYLRSAGNFVGDFPDLSGSTAYPRLRHLGFVNGIVLRNFIELLPTSLESLYIQQASTPVDHGFWHTYMVKRNNPWKLTLDNTGYNSQQIADLKTTAEACGKRVYIYT